MTHDFHDYHTFTYLVCRYAVPSVKKNQNNLKLTQSYSVFALLWDLLKYGRRLGVRG